MTTTSTTTETLSARKTIDQIEVASKRVLMRVDFNVPLQDGRITDDRRIREAQPSIQSVLDRRGRLILISHLGRPGGDGFDAAFSLRPVADRLKELLNGINVSFPDTDCISDTSAKAVESLGDGQVLLLENLRFHAGEKAGQADFGSKLAGFGDVYCNEAFSTSHRSDASMVALPKAMAGKPRVVGMLMHKELEFLSETIENAQKPFVAVLGGAKVSDKLPAIQNLLGKVDTILIGGAMAFTFLKALDREIGSSLVQLGMLEKARDLIDDAAASPTDLILPDDHVCGKQITSMTPVEVFEQDIPTGWMGLDIGPKTTAHFDEILRNARTIVWNGPMGVFETSPFEVGTKQIAASIASATTGGAVTVVGGGDSAAAIEDFKMGDCFTHISTGGGAALEMLEGKQFASLKLMDPT